MGYNGLGMQRWIYNLRPRRPFSKDRKPYPCDSFERHQRDYNPVLPSGSDTKENIFLKYLKEEKKTGRFKIMLAILISLFLILFVLAIIENESPTNENVEEILDTDVKYSSNYNYLVKSGYIYIYKFKIEKAISEFRLAIACDSIPDLAYKGLVYCLIIDCDSNYSSCKEAEKIIKSRLSKNSNDSEWIKYNNQLLNMNNE